MISVGEDFSLVQQRVIGTGSVMELLDGGMFLVAIYIPEITNKEIELLRNSTMKVKIFRVDDFAIYLVRLGESSMIFELTFDPTLYSQDKQQGIFKSNIVLIVGIDSLTNQVKTLRMANMPKVMYETVLDILNNTKRYISSITSKQLYPVLHKTTIETLRAKFSTTELWTLSAPAGKMGE